MNFERKIWSIYWFADWQGVIESATFIFPIIYYPQWPVSLVFVFLRGLRWCWKMPVSKWIFQSYPFRSLLSGGTLFLVLGGKYSWNCLSIILVKGLNGIYYMFLRYVQKMRHFWNIWNSTDEAYRLNVFLDLRATLFRLNLKIRLSRKILPSFKSELFGHRMFKHI